MKPQHQIRPRTDVEMERVRAARREKTELFAQAFERLRSAKVHRESMTAAGFPDDPSAPARDVSKVILAAATDPRLFSLRLRALLVAAGMSSSVVDARLAKMRWLLSLDPRVGLDPTIGWLLDRRVRGQRVATWVEVHAVVERPTTSWPYGPPVIGRRSEAGADGPPGVGHVDQVSVVAHRPRSDGGFTDAMTEIRAEAPVPLTRVSLHSDTDGLVAPSRLEPFHQHFLAVDNDKLLSARQRAARRSLGIEPRARPAAPRRDGLVQRLLEDLSLFVRVAGALFSFRTLTEDQVVALAAPAHSARSVRRLLEAGYECELFSRSETRGTDVVVPRLYAMRSKETWDYFCRYHLPVSAILAITGGQPWIPGSDHSRHDVLAAELMLRWAVGGTAEAILGEAFASRRDLSSSILLDGSERWANGRGDGVVVRDDGLVIALELTANVNRAFESKVDAWLEHQYRSGDAGVGATVFVVATDPFGDATRAMARARRSIDAALDRRGLRRWCDRIGLVGWCDWFPTSTAVRENAFLGMKVAVPGPVSGRWGTRSLLSVRDYPHPSPHVAEAGALVNALLLGQSPAFLSGTGSLRRLADQDGLPSGGLATCGWSALPIADRRHPSRAALDRDAAAARSTLPARMKWRL